VVTISNSSKGIGETIGQLSRTRLPVVCAKEVNTKVPRSAECNLENIVEQIIEVSGIRDIKAGEKKNLLGTLSAIKAERNISPTTIPAMAEIMLHLLKAKQPNGTRLV